MLRALIAAVLVAFVVGIAILMATTPPLYFIAERLTRLEHDAIADACASEVRAIGPQPLRESLESLRGRYGLEAIEVERAGEQSILSGVIRSSHGEVLSRQRVRERVTIYFGQSPLPQVLRNFKIAATAGSAATVGGLILLMLYIVSLARNDGRQSSDPRPALTDTYVTSFRALKGRADEFKELHLQQKKRADELANISATLVRSLTSGFITIDDEGMLLDINQTARDLLGIDPLRPDAQVPVIEGLGRSRFSEVLQEAVEGKRTLQREEIVDRNGADERIIGLSTVPLVDENGRHLGMIALFTDLTPVRRLETRIRDMQSLADLGEMSAGIAHEFRNSLSTILGYLKLAQKENPEGASAVRLRSAEQEARLLTAAVESLLSFARPLSLELQPLDAIELVRDIVHRLQPVQSAIDVQFRGSSAVMNGDAALLRRAFENILRNSMESIEQSGRKGQITVESSSVPAPRIVISDNGIGLADEDAARLFLPFQSGKPNGFGLGLALTKKIIVLHGGWIRLTGTPGAGATVTVEFPPDRAEANTN